VSEQLILTHRYDSSRSPVYTAIWLLTRLSVVDGIEDAPVTKIGGVMSASAD